MVITGQQPCLLGGASLTLHKILHALSVSNWLNQNGVNAVPIFWSASEDHDLHEMLRVELWNKDFTPQLHKLTNIKRGFSAETFAEPVSLHQSLANDLSPWLKEGFFSKPSQRFVDPFHHALQHCFGSSGLISLEPKDLAESGTNFWDDLHLKANDLFEAYEKNDQWLIKKGQPLQAIRRRGLPLFALNQQSGERRPIDYQDGNFYLEKKSDRNPLNLLNPHERLSPGALLRPIFAQSQMPIITTILGPAEYQYHRQLPLAYGALQQPMPVCWPRLGGTYLPDKLVDFFQLERQDLCNYILNGQRAWLKEDPGLQEQLKKLEIEAENLNRDIQNIHHPHTGPLARFERDLSKAFSRLQRGIDKAKLIRQGWPNNKLQLCEDLLLPKGQAQERRLGWAQFLTSQKKLEQLMMVFDNPFDFSHRIYS